MRGKEQIPEHSPNHFLLALTCQLSMNLLQLLSAVLFCLLLELLEGPSQALQLHLLDSQLSLPTPLQSLRKQAPGPAPDVTSQHHSPPYP